MPFLVWRIVLVSLLFLAVSSPASSGFSTPAKARLRRALGCQYTGGDGSVFYLFR